MIDITPTCVWCGEDAADDTCHDLHGRTGGLDHIGYAPLCEYCEKVNDYLWETGYAVRRVEREVELAA